MGALISDGLSTDSITSASDMPVIDYQKLTGRANERKEALRLLDKSFQAYGFIYLLNHSIPQEMVDEAFAWCKRFFSLDHSVKSLVAHPASGAVDDHRGFAKEGLGLVSQLIFDEAKVADLRLTSPERKETLEMGNPYPNKESAPNRWLPEDALPGMRAFCERWWDACTALEKSMLRILGEALELDDSELLYRKQRRDLCHMSWNYYPSMPIGPLKSRQLRRLNAHSDFGCLTLLFQDGVGGLEVHDGHVFRPVVPKRGTVVINVADMLERQTNGRWKSALHQVVAPRESMMQKGFEPVSAVIDRYSLVYFGLPDPEVIIDTLPGREQRGKWDPNMKGDWGTEITAAEWLQKRLALEY
ncbi:uncharacterized protein JN550_005271 [Neoarthrinium moseri]|uniref:uncharacterized protein n=1 Tax=Neoarthrinium moseri TaxID=1658444 RepID=UPI001FDD8175|nr:uncharacterized protein JN550_005271 [Neoarthrinium moseri]KAI1870343.1 hypothetical protein JN550_005271 [Neoarthrinium moseri]